MKYSLTVVTLMLFATPTILGQGLSTRLASRVSQLHSATGFEFEPNRYQLSHREVKLLKKHVREMEQETVPVICQNKPKSIRCLFSSLFKLFHYTDPNIQSPTNQESNFSPRRLSRRDQPDLR